MATLTWKRGKAEAKYQHGGGVERTVTHTTHSTTLTSGDTVTITTVDGTFFMDRNGSRIDNWWMKLGDAKAATQRREDAQVAKAAQEAEAAQAKASTVDDFLDAEYDLNPDLDDRDREALAKAVAEMDARQGIKVGDHVRFADGTERRVSHVWEWGNGPESIQTSDGGSFHLSASGHVSMSGGLHPGMKPETFRSTSERKPGRVWIWHHGRPAASNGVDCLVEFPVWENTEPAN